MRKAYPPYKTRSAVGWIRRVPWCEGAGTWLARAASTRGRALPSKLGTAGAPRQPIVNPITLRRAVSDQLSAFSFAFQTFLTTRPIVCRVGACGSKTVHKMLMHLWLRADR